MPRKKKTIHYIYKTTCNVTNRYYIGMHSTTKIDDGYMGSGKRLRRSIRKYGEENHTKEILEYFDTRELLIEGEIKAITPEMITDNDCMNLMGGGNGGLLSKEHHKKMRKGASKWMSNNWEDEEFREKMVKQLKENSRNAHKNGNINYNTFEGRSHSDETKKLISESSKGKGEGYNNSQYGTCWITNGKESKKIFKGDNIPEGWSLGRKMKT